MDHATCLLLPKIHDQLFNTNVRILYMCCTLIGARRVRLTMSSQPVFVLYVVHQVRVACGGVYIFVECQ